MSCNFMKYLGTYSGSALIRKYGEALDVQGVWQVKGEDPNCDFGGSHYQPILATVQGKLIDVVKAGVDMPKFWTWGGGGDFVEVKIITVSDIKNRSDIERQIREKEAELAELKKKMGV